MQCTRLAIDPRYLAPELYDGEVAWGQTTRAKARINGHHDTVAFYLAPLSQEDLSILLGKRGYGRQVEVDLIAANVLAVAVEPLDVYLSPVPESTTARMNAYGQSGMVVVRQVDPLPFRHRIGVGLLRHENGVPSSLELRLQDGSDLKDVLHLGHAPMARALQEVPRFKSGQGLRQPLESPFRDLELDSK